MSTGRRIPDHIRAAAITDYHTSGQSLATVSQRHGVSKAALSAWIRPGHVRRVRKPWPEEEIALDNGHWIPNSRGVQIWQPCFYDSIHDCTINHQENQHAA